MCLYPKLIKNRKYIANKKNGGDIPAVSDKRVLYVPVGCGKCIECMKQKARNWQVRLLEDVRHNKNGKFITLTFSNESIAELIAGKKRDNGTWERRPIEGLTGYELDNEIATRATRLFLERWRKEHKKSLRHWLVTELGHNGTENIHMHGIVWTDKSMDEVEKHWQYGWVWKGNKTEKGKVENYVSERTVNYITKYINKIDEKHKEYKPKVLTSAGIGKDYINREDAKGNKYKGTETVETYRSKTGHKMAMPIYYRNKIYSDEEREKLWLEKLDKQERWVCGERIDISRGDKEYWKALEYYRKKNARLGYGDDSKNWERKQYENDQRALKLKERIKKTGYWIDESTGEILTEKPKRSRQEKDTFSYIEDVERNN